MLEPLRPTEGRNPQVVGDDAAHDSFVAVGQNLEEEALPMVSIEHPFGRAKSRSRLRAGLIVTVGLLLLGGLVGRRSIVALARGPMEEGKQLPRPVAEGSAPAVEEVLPPQPRSVEEQAQTEPEEPHPPAEGQPLEEAPTPQKRRLQKVRELLPSAERLSKLLSRPQADSLLQRFQEALVQKRPAQGQPESADEIELHVEKALEALRTLHLYGVERVRAIMKEDEALGSFPDMGDLETTLKEELFDEGERVTEDTVLRMVDTLMSIQQTAEDAHTQLVLVCQFLATHAFRTEEDGDLLTGAAPDIEYLLHNVHFRSYLYSSAGTLREHILEGIRAKVLREIEEVLLPLEGKVKLLRISVDSARVSKNRGAGESSEAASELQDVEWQLEQAEALAAGMRRQLGDVVRTSSNEDMARYCKKVEEVDAERRISSWLNGGGSQLEYSRVLQDAVYEEQLTKIKQVAYRVQIALDQAAESAQKLAQADDTETALECLNTQMTHLTELIRAKEAARLLLVDSKFIEWLETDTGRQHNSFEAVALYELPERIFDKKCLESAKRVYEEARRRLMGAKTLVEVEDALGSVRYALISLHVAVGLYRKDGNAQFGVSAP
ncbi:uncharacterized protein EMH_0014730 [Eimeria mitis]|uniref:Uncharacterized protein n=1 Tax=Eimeria mitis TaxID=44415 RepID=U6K5I8_9EIME|nr:uncharacterized protein EMH_0014730 [Eimeria mitis]CDJ33100.1 hypothetical protein, conserved [Eimeria mitis]